MWLTLAFKQNMVSFRYFLGSIKLTPWIIKCYTFPGFFSRWMCQVKPFGNLTVWHGNVPCTVDHLLDIYFHGHGFHGRVGWVGFGGRRGGATTDHLGMCLQSLGRFRGTRRGKPMNLSLEWNPIWLMKPIWMVKLNLGSETWNHLDLGRWRQVASF